MTGRPPVEASSHPDPVRPQRQRRQTPAVHVAGGPTCGACDAPHITISGHLPDGLVAAVAYMFACHVCGGPPHSQKEVLDCQAPVVLVAAFANARRVRLALIHRHRKCRLIAVLTRALRDARLVFGLPSPHPQEVSLIGMLAYLSYLSGEYFGLSGIVTLFCCGVVISHYALHNVSSMSRVTTVGHALVS